MTDPDQGIYDFVDDDPRPAPPRVQPAAPSPSAPPLPCSKCGYNLRGSRFDRCPECGKQVSFSSLTRESNNTVNLWRDVYREPVLWSLFGLVTGFTIYAISDGLIGISAYAIACLFLVISGWIVFTLCSLLWIGFDQPLRTTAVQLAGAYIGALGVSEILALTGLPLFPWLVSVMVLVGLLHKLLDIELNDAIILAFLVMITRTLIIGALVAAVIALF